MKVSAISASPRHGGNSDVLCDRFLQGAADPEHSAADETIAGLRGYLRCLPGAAERGVILGTGTWDKGDVYKHPSYNMAYDSGKALTDER